MTNIRMGAWDKVLVGPVVMSVIVDCLRSICLVMKRVGDSASIRACCRKMPLTLTGLMGRFDAIGE